MAIKRSAATELSFMGNFVSQNPKRSGHEICHCEMTGFQGVKSSAAGSRNVDFSGVTQGHCSLSDEPVHLSVVGRLGLYSEPEGSMAREGSEAGCATMPLKAVMPSSLPAATLTARSIHPGSAMRSHASPSRVEKTSPEVVTPSRRCAAVS